MTETARLSRLENHQELVENLQQVQREMDEMLNPGGSVPRDFSEVFSVPQPPTESLARLGEEFRKAQISFDESQAEATGEEPLLDLSSEDVLEIRNSLMAQQAQPVVATAIVKAAAPAPVVTPSRRTDALAQARAAAAQVKRPQPKSDVIRKVEFPRIDMPTKS